MSIDADTLTFDQLPQAVALLLHKITSLEEKVDKSNNADKWFDINQLCEYLPGKPKKTTIYAKIDDIPHSKNGKRLIFRKSEIDEWLADGGWNA